MKKRGQATIFIIIAIIAVVAIFIFVRTYSQREQLNREYFEKTGRTPSIKNIQGFILDCYKETSKQALIIIGIQGGYYNKPEYYFDMQWSFIPYYYYETSEDNGLYLNPSKEKIQQELSSYIDNNLNKCLDKIKFPNFDLSYNSPITKTLIKKSETVFTTAHLITITHNQDKIDFELSQHQLTLKSSLKEILEVSDYITNSHKENPNLMCINCISELAKERQLYVDFIAIEDDTTLVMILENRTMEEPYIFEFLNRYDIVEIKENLNINENDPCLDLSKHAKQNSSGVILRECRKYYNKSCTNNSDCGSFPCYNNKCLIKPCDSDLECPNSLCGLHITPAPGFCTLTDVI